MIEINDNDIRDKLYNISKSIIIPKYKNLKEIDIKLKNKKDLVTSVDINVENILKVFLQELLPNSLFIGEESFFLDANLINAYKENQYCWTVDPIDGTSNYVNGKDRFAIMIALTFKETILQTWIYKPLNDEFIYSKLGHGTFINEKKIYNKIYTDVSKSTGSISSKYWDKDSYHKIENIKNKFKQVNSYGCIGFEYVDIAEGNRNFTILSKLSPWDHIPGVLIVKEAGCSVMHFDKTNYNYINKKNNLVVANSDSLLDEIINLIGG
ncbi:inositol monophosphatase [Alphaproteobacteria bacterium]|nr:inositol monophosphatase [Alphaproteobacteria bacterium]